MRIIEAENGRIFKCLKCNCVFETENYGSEIDSTNERCYVTKCPKCGDSIYEYIDENEIEDNEIEKLEKRIERVEELVNNLNEKLKSFEETNSYKKIRAIF